MHMLFEEGFLKDTIKRFSYYKELGDKTFEQIDEAAIFYQPSTESNSIAIIVQHMYGNMLSRWTNFLTEDGEKEWRVVVFLQQLDGLRGDFAVGVLLVFPRLVREKRHGCAEAALWRVVDEFGLQRRPVAPGRVVEFFPR